MSEHTQDIVELIGFTVVLVAWMLGGLHLTIGLTKKRHDKLLREHFEGKR